MVLSCILFSKQAKIYIFVKKTSFQSMRHFLSVSEVIFLFTPPLPPSPPTASPSVVSSSLSSSLYMRYVCQSIDMQVVTYLQTIGKEADKWSIPLLITNGWLISHYRFFFNSIFYCLFFVFLKMFVLFSYFVL